MQSNLSVNRIGFWKLENFSDMVRTLSGCFGPERIRIRKQAEVIQTRWLTLTLIHRAVP